MGQGGVPISEGDFEYLKYPRGATFLLGCTYFPAIQILEFSEIIAPRPNANGIFVAPLFSLIQPCLPSISLRYQVFLKPRFFLGYGEKFANSIPGGFAKAEVGWNSRRNGNTI
jgi:hypothetical protein